MTSGLGVDPTKNGTTITSGTTSQDIQQIFGGLYSPGLVSGGTIVRSPVNMTYTVSSGVAVVPMAVGLNVPIPIPATTITADTVPTSGPRTDIIYAQQRTPAIEGDSNVIVSYGPTLPARSVMLGKFTYPAGSSNSNAGTAESDLTYSIPFSAGMGRLYYYQYPGNGNLPNGLTRVGSGKFFLPTDRLVTFKVTAVLSAAGAVRFDNNAYTEYGFLANYNGGDFVLWASPGLHQAWSTYTFESTVRLSAGSYTTNLGLVRLSGPGTAVVHLGTDTQGYGRTGIEYSITDAGAVS